ncbi:unnamed protein product [Echinostoma caproni]|uniref:UPF0020 domain-containing protein n=1 Tax=Echinostoma caproni TaxID=27848 RepID=A0A183B3R5_9TREM|nr:unnamed protein product [Echinostoma caproni]
MKYIIAFAASEFVNFRQAEFRALAELQGLQADRIVTDWSEDYWLRPYVIVELDSDAQAEALVERSVLIKSIYHCWCDADSFPQLLTKVPYNPLQLLIHNLPESLTNQYLSRLCTYKVVISSANKKIDQESKLKMIEDVLNAHPVLEATVCLKNPQHQLNILLDYAPKNWPKLPPGAAKEHLRHLYYGRLVAISKRRELINSYRLADRNYLGNTSMDVRLSGIMANVGLCGPGTLVWDPFLGTGSIVLAASIWGAYGAGSDIDYALLHGMGMSPKAGQVLELRHTHRRPAFAVFLDPKQTFDSFDHEALMGSLRKGMPQKYVN